MPTYRVEREIVGRSMAAFKADNVEILYEGIPDAIAAETLLILATPDDEGWTPITDSTSAAAPVRIAYDASVCVRGQAMRWARVVKE